MKHYCGLLLFVVLALSTPVQAAEREQLAEQAALAWLAQLDAGDYQGSWQNAASLFRSQVTSDQWEQAASAVRNPLGALNTRELVKATYATSLPGAPDGEYVVLQFRTVFENKSAAVETVTPMRDGDEWRVSGYFVR